jgi:hypothetical protein
VSDPDRGQRAPTAPGGDVADEWAAVARALAAQPQLAAAVDAQAAVTVAPPTPDAGWTANGWGGAPLPSRAPVVPATPPIPVPVPVPVVEPAQSAAAPAAGGVAAGTAEAPGGTATAVQDLPPHRPADLRLAMADGGARRDLRRILIAYGAIGKARPDGAGGTPARPEDVIGAFMTATEPVVDALLRSAGAITDERRLTRFAASIAAVGEQSDPTDPASVRGWIAAVGAILRDDASV